MTLDFCVTRPCYILLPEKTNTQSPIEKFSFVYYLKKSVSERLLNGVKKQCDEFKKVPMFKIGSVG